GRSDPAAAVPADIGRYLSDEPVLACPPSVGYRLGKFVRRHRGPVLAASLLLLALLSGIIGTTVGLLRANASAAAEKLARGTAEQKQTDRKSTRLNSSH